MYRSWMPASSNPGRKSVGPSYPKHSLEEGAELLDGYISLDSWNPYHMAVPSKYQDTGYLYQRVVLEESGKLKYAPKFLAH